jgi:hypothetical protein
MSKKIIFWDRYRALILKELLCFVFCKKKSVIKLHLKECGGMVRIGFIWLRTGTSGGLV